jgi:hypothetical protein
VLASVVGGRDPHDIDHDLEALSPSGSSVNSYSKESEAFTGIKVTTNVTQKSISHSKISVVADDKESTKEMV